MCPAIHISSRSWLRSSSTHEPSDPPLRVVHLSVFWFFEADQHKPRHGKKKLVARPGRAPTPPRSRDGEEVFKPTVPFSTPGGVDQEPTGTRRGLRLSPRSFFTEGGFRSAGADPRHLVVLFLGPP